jgi:hypothetical protein
MDMFIWVRDKDKVEHYINTHHILRVTKVPAGATWGEYSYILMNDGFEKRKTINLSRDDYDTYDEVISKIDSAVRWS